MGGNNLDNLAEEKQAIRKSAFAARKVVHDEYEGTSATQHLLSYLGEFTGKVISGYMPIRTEIDPLPSMAELSKSSPIGVPVILGEAMPLEFHRWHANEPMTEGPFGAMIPIDAKVVVPEILIVPMVAFDKFGHRLGYGGGYYDRTLELLRANGNVIAVGFAYAGQQIDELPTEPTDQTLDAIVTENGVQFFDGK